MISAPLNSISNLAASKKDRTINNTFCVWIGQANYLIKQHDTGVFATRPATSFAPTMRFVKMPRIYPVCAQEEGAGTGHGVTPRLSPRAVLQQREAPYEEAQHKATPLATRKELSDFLAAVERRAYKQALFAARDEQVALDAVQDAMMKLSEKYAARPSTELPMLFQRILQNTIRDHFRRQKVRSLWTTPVSSLFGGEDGDEHDPLETLQVKSDSNPQEAPSDQLQQSQTLEIIEKALHQLPARQRQAFMLRYWEEMNVAEAAAVMGCSEGSVKTHCSRATHALASLLKDKGILL